MKTFMYDFAKDKEYKQTPSDEYIQKFMYVDINMRHQWKKDTLYRRGDIVYDYIETKNFFILYYEGTSSTVDSIYDDELEWYEYNAMTTKTMTNFNEILLQSDIKKYSTDDKYYDIYNVPTNIKIEQIAYEYYEDINYWDVILVLNNMKTYLDLPKSNDIVISRTLEKLKKWGDLFGYTDIDFEYLDNYLNNIVLDKGTEKGTWGIYKDIRTSFENESSTGGYYLNKGDLIKVRDYEGRKDVLFYYKNQSPKEIVMTFGSTDSESPPNPIFPLEINDKLSISVKDIDLLHTVSAGDSQYLNNSVFSLLPHFDTALINADIYGITHITDYTPGSESITFKNNPDLLDDYNVYINQASSLRQIPGSGGIPGKPEDVIKINTITDNTIQEMVQNNYLVEVDDNFVLIDYDDKETLEKYELLLSMYRKYLNEMEEENNKHQFLKVLKPEYLNEFKEAFQSKRKKILNLDDEYNKVQ